MSENVVVKVGNVYKDFKLPHEKTDSLKSTFTSLYKKKNRTIETQHALKDISFEIKKGEFFGIVGRNGSGKSTLLKIIAGIYQPTAGGVSVTGKLVPFIELGVGFNPELTGRENVYLNGALLGFSQQEINSMYKDIVDFAELQPFMEQKLKNYSSGMQVRLAFSVATRAKADILLVDEVLAVGDADFQRKCFDYFKKLKRDKKTVIFVGHDMNAIREYCDRAVLIEKSELILEGNSDKVASAYTKMFLDDPSRNDSNVDGTDEEEKRWGGKDAVFTDISLSKTQLNDNEKELVITMTMKANKDVRDINVGFLVRSPTGLPILGTNSQILKSKFKTLTSGETKQLKWTIPNIFSEGSHSISLALECNSNVSDWWDDALQFDVALARKTPYLVSPEITLQ